LDTSIVEVSWDKDRGRWVGPGRSVIGSSLGRLVQRGLKPIPVGTRPDDLIRLRAKVKATQNQLASQRASLRQEIITAVEVDGIPITDVAVIVGMTKQSVSDLVLAAKGGK
jgi:hypothetical protein